MNNKVQYLLLDQTETQLWYLVDEYNYGGANKAHADFLGINKKDLENANLYDFLSKEEAESCVKGNKQVFKTKENTYTEEWVQNGKGEKKLLSITKSPIIDSCGNVEFVTCSAEDITEKREYETRLKENEELFREITENMQDMVALTDKYGYFVYAGPSHELVIGYKPENLTGKNVLDFVHPDDYEWMVEEYQQFLQTLNPKKVEYRYLHSDGYYIWLETIGNVIHDDYGNVKRVVFSSRDITEHKELENELINTYSIINSSPAVAFLWANEDGWPVKYVSENVIDTFGYSAGDFTANKLSYADVINPDDLGRVVSEVYYYSNDPDCVKFQHKPYRIITKNENIRWVDDRTYILRDDDGNVTNYQGIILDITENKVINDKLKENEKMLDDVFESIQDGISVIDSDFNIVRVNSKMNEWYEENVPLEGKKCYHAYQYYESPCEKCPTDSAFRTGKTQMDIVTGLPGSKPKWFEIYSYPVINGDNGEISSVVEFVRDISDRVDAEQKLEKSRNMLQDIIQNIPVGICITDKNGYFDSVNPAYCSIYGYNSDELVGKHFTVVVPEEYKKELSSLHDRFIKGIDELSGEWPVIDKDSNPKTILATATKVQDFDDEPKKVTFVIDITGRKQTENKLQDYTNELERLNEIREIFTDILRHDLLNPVGIVKGYANLLYKKETDENKLKILDKMIINNERAIELIENAGNLARIDCMENIEFNRFDIGEIIEEVIDNMRFSMYEKNIDIKFVNNGPYYANLNPIIEQAFTNLINNSIKYNPENSGIKVEIFDDIDYWKVQIKDEGPGISEQDKKYIFDRFKRGEGKKVSGKGIGLAIVQKIVDIHEGSVGVEDNPDGKGSMFWVKLKKSYT
ncbi:PAS/PAC sensor signal transduction histidine kinase [Methanohalobium evestigatum Z-7303]|uniref:histidine kinase n=1 Tax=Methanohalobium evestigatum (strain ATCC BAA-1072 / DSM 3721 / NBRC 107634 / OCM 161 / Z-7303) TaxID=644295 RepID=D7E989_METEZ|nr:PAS domain S-box protein [Methanohalobium evestigatum]ADI74037.1 PAS/PAC sensor signal transduction histidine kinase [Methanohalobium evestigatum Z-7303]